MSHTIEVKHINKDRISILGKEYCSEEYLIEMMRREYLRGREEGSRIHVAQIQSCSNCATQHQ